MCQRGNLENRAVLGEDLTGWHWPLVTVRTKEGQQLVGVGELKEKDWEELRGPLGMQWRTPQLTHS